MAKKEKTVAGNTYTYLITDYLGSTVSVAVTQNPGSGITCTFTSVGNLHHDGQRQVMELLQQIGTGLIN